LSLLLVAPISHSRSFPTRRSSDLHRYLLALLNSRLLTFRFRGLGKLTGPKMWESFDNSIAELPIRRIDFDTDEVGIHDRLVDLRSEEHTSELQSRVDLVCRLLLEK